MAPELALETLRSLNPASTVLDPMAGSGTVLRHAAEMGHKAIGRDLDPLAVLMARVWTTKCDASAVRRTYERIVKKANSLDGDKVALPWIDGDAEAVAFTKYWFGATQRRVLRSIAYAIASEQRASQSKSDFAALDVVRVALSRIIVTKEQCASLARDTSHSRPHKVAQRSSYDVYEGFARSLNSVLEKLLRFPVPKGSEVRISEGDARKTRLKSESIDAVLTSPPYLNAIDYMRGHRMSLIWFGYSLALLREVRGCAIGTERGLRKADFDVLKLKTSFGDLDRLTRRDSSMFDRYIRDVCAMVTESARVLRKGGCATFVVGNSCLRGVYVRNAEVVAAAAELAGLVEKRRYDRDLPNHSRYLPTSSPRLAKRMRSETILSFVKPN